MVRTRHHPAYERINRRFLSLAADERRDGFFLSIVHRAVSAAWVRQRLTTARRIVAYVIGAAPSPAGLLR